MKFTKEKYPLLYKGHKSKYESKLMQLMYDEIHENNAPVYWVSKNLLKDACLNYDKICKERISPGNYIIILDNVFVFIAIEIWDNPELRKGTIVVMKGHEIAFMIDLIGDHLLFKGIHKSLNSDDIQPYADIVNQHIVSLMFIHHADIKQKQCPPRGRCDLFHCKYKSDVDVKINICDQSWYIECLQTHKFCVRAHYRWQVCGKGRQQRKYIQVKEHDRHRYEKGAMIEGNAKQRKERKKRKVFGASGKCSNN